MEAIVLTPLHYIYLIGVIVVLATMIGRKDTVLPCIIFTFIMGYVAHGDIIRGLQACYNAWLFSGIEFFGIIATIAAIVAMSKSMADMGADYLMMNPIAKMMKTPDAAFFILGIAMMIITWFIWPSPAVALIGGIMTPIAVRIGLPPIGSAITMNIFGHGVAFSMDFIIQGAPGVTGAAAGIEPGLIVEKALPIFVTVSVVAVILSYVFLKRDLIKNHDQYEAERLEAISKDDEEQSFSWKSKFMAVFIPLSFVVAVFLMVKMGLKGGDATALVSGVAIALMSIGAVLQFGLIDALESISDYIRAGFSFGMKIFAPVVVIAGFFFIGGSGMNVILMGEFGQGVLMDWGWWLSQQVPLSKYPVAAIMMLVGSVVGLDGSGFAGLPLVGAMAATFGNAINLDIAVLAALGQIGAIWVGGATLVPWGVIPVAAMCNVDPVELCRRNLVPVVVGMICGVIVSFFIL